MTIRSTTLSFTAMTLLVLSSTAGIVSAQVDGSGGSTTSYTNPYAGTNQANIPNTNTASPSGASNNATTGVTSENGISPNTTAQPNGTAQFNGNSETNLNTNSATAGTGGPEIASSPSVTGQINSGAGATGATLGSTTTSTGTTGVGAGTTGATTTGGGAGASTAGGAGAAGGGHGGGGSAGGRR